MALVKPPHPDASLEPFREGVGILTHEGRVAGHVCTVLWEFWSPFSPRRRQWWVWLIVVWADGEREPSVEDYPPWTYVAEMQRGAFVWEEGSPRDGSYEFAWLPQDEARAVREQLRIKPDDF